jgi:predicted transcriptional regulator
MGMGEAALLAWFGSELADDRLLILAVLKDAGRLAVEEIASRLALDLATVKLALGTLLAAELVTPVDGGACYQAGGPNFDDLIKGLAESEPSPARS